MNFEHLKDSVVKVAKEPSTRAGVASLLYVAMCVVLKGFDSAALEGSPIEAFPGMPSGKTMLILGGAAVLLKGRDWRDWLKKFLDQPPSTKL